MKIHKYEIHIGGNLNDKIDGARVRLEIPEKIKEVDQEVAGILNDIKDKIGCLEATLKKNYHIYRRRDEAIPVFKEPIKGRWK